MRWSTPRTGGTTKMRLLNCDSARYQASSHSVSNWYWYGYIRSQPSVPGMVWAFTSCGTGNFMGLSPVGLRRGGMAARGTGCNASRVPCRSDRGPPRRGSARALPGHRNDACSVDQERERRDPGFDHLVKTHDPTA